jgi:hypothetical protein
MPSRLARVLLHRSPDGRHVLERSAHEWHQFGPLRRKDGPGPVALEEASAKITLELPDLLTKRGLAQVNHLGGSPVVEHLCQGQEGLHVTHLHGP